MTVGELRTMLDKVPEDTAVTMCSYAGGPLIEVYTGYLEQVSEGRYPIMVLYSSPGVNINGPETEG